MRTAKGIIAIALVLVTVACSGPTPGPQTVIHEDAVVLDASDRDQLSEYHQDGTLVFTAAAGESLPDLAVGDVLVSEPAGSAAPDGLLRRVTGLDTSVAGRLSVATEQATIMDIVEKGALHEDFEMNEDDIASIEVLVDEMSFTMMDDARLAAAVAAAAAAAGEGAAVPAGAAPAGAAGLDPQQLGSFGFDFEVVVFDTDGDEQTKNDQMTAFGAITLKPKASIDLDVHCSYWCFGGIDVDFAAGLGMNETAKLGLKGKGPLGLNLQKSISLATFTMKPITFFIGPVPVVITPRLTVSLKFEGGVGASVTYEVSQALTMGVEVTYDDGWAASADLDNDFSVGPVKADEPVSAVLVAKAKGSASAELMFYGVLGPTFELAPYFKVDLRYPRDPIWKLDGGIEANLGVHIDVLGWDKSYQTNVLDDSIEIARAGNQAPLLDFQNDAQTVSVVAGGLMLRSLVADAEEGSPCCTVTYRSSDLADGTNGLLGSASDTLHEVLAVFQTLGARTVTATAVDTKGATTEQSITVTVMNEPPSVFMSSPFNDQEFFRGQPVRLRASSYDSSEPGQSLDCSTQMVWTSSVEGDALPVNGCQATVSFSTDGPRTLTLTGADSHGGLASASVDVTVVPPPSNLPPVVNVTSPADGITVGPHTVLVLTGTAVDPESEGIQSVVWDVLNDYDPFTGTGGSTFPVTLSGGNQWRPQDSIDYTPGLGGCEVNDTLRLRMRATDVDGVTGFDFVVLRVIVVC